MSIAINSTNFPDEEFRNYISTNFDLDEDDVLSDTEITNATTIQISNNTTLSSLQGISFLTNLQVLRLNQCSAITSINIGSNTGLYLIEILLCSNLSSLTGLDNLVDLESLRVAFTSISAIDVTHNTKLKSLYVDNNASISSLTLNQNEDLETLSIAYTAIELIDLRSNPAIKKFYADHATDLETLYFPANPLLEELSLSATSISSLDTFGLENLRRLNIIDVDISSLDLRNCPKLSYLVNNVSPENENPLMISYYNGTELWTLWANSSTALITNEIRITQQPQDSIVTAGYSATFSVSAVGADLHYQWEVRANGNAQWTEILNENNESLSIIAAVANDGYQYRCLITNANDRKYSNIATLSTLYAPIIVTHPQNQTTTNGHNVTFEVDAQGNGLQFQWETYEDGAWVELRNETSASLMLLASLSLSGRVYRCKIQNESGSVTSNAAELTVEADTSIAAPTILVHPTSAIASEGDEVTFEVVANGEGLLYQWQTFSDDAWHNISDATEDEYTLVAIRNLGGSRYRCMVSNAAGSVYTNAATLTISSGSYISTPRILIQPRDLNVDLGEVVFFWIRADGGNLNYQWQMQNNGSWYDITGAIGNTYTFTARSEMHGKHYRCVVSNTAGSIISNTVTLSLQADIDISFYGYHSIIISGKNTYAEWHMYPTSRPHVAPPEVKTAYVDLPGANGGLDYTDLLNGEPKFGYRKGSWEFLLIPQDEWASVYRSLVSFLHGREHTVILEDDPNYVYTGRLSVNQWQSAAHNSLITINYILDPIPRNISGEEAEAQDEADLDAASRLLLKEENVGMAIALVNGSAVILDPEMLFTNGDNVSY